MFLLSVGYPLRASGPASGLDPYIPIARPIRIARGWLGLPTTYVRQNLGCSR